MPTGNPKWTPKEAAALKALDRALKAIPRSVNLCTTDGEITACKRGVSSFDLSWQLPGRLSVGAILTNLHDNDPAMMERDHADR